MQPHVWVARPDVPDGPLRYWRPGASGDAASASTMHWVATVAAQNAASMCALATGAGGSEFTIEPSGQRRSNGRNSPAENGRSWQSSVHTSATSSLSMMYGFELKKCGACGDAPVKSKMRVSPATVNVHGTA